MNQVAGRGGAPNRRAFDGPGFDTSVGGTPESHWAAFEPPAWSPPAGPLVVVSPHPDDETLGAGGLIHTWAVTRGLPVLIVSVTDGEAACPEVTGLAAIRRRELAAAQQDLGPTGIAIIHLQLPDGHVREHRQELADALDSIAPDGPRATIVAPFEQDGHPDHDATSEVAKEVARRHDTTFAQYPIWAWHQATRAIFATRDVGRFMLTPAAHRAKQSAIRRFQSQLRDRPGGAIVPAHVLEYFERPHEVFVL
ncbi:MAG TPA: PIG-L family deacetylase [Steroidobacteraceae bacterium]